MSALETRTEIQYEDPKELLFKLPQTSVKSDIGTHFMFCGLRDYLQGKLDARPMLCMGWLYFKDKLSLKEVKRHVMETLVSRVTRYRALPVERDGWSFWDTIEPSDFDMDYHFSEVGKFETLKEFQDYLEKTAKQGLDYTKPFWKFILIDELPCGRCAVLNVTDHTLGDGASQVSGLLSMCEEVGDNPVYQRAKLKAKKKRSRKLNLYEKLQNLSRGTFKPILEAILPPDTHTKLKLPDNKPFPRSWHFAMTTPEQQMDLHLVKEIKDRVGTGCTVNDVLLALTALAIKSYYLEINEPIMHTKRDVTATYVVNHRPASANYLADEWFGNHITVATTPYPLHESRIGTLLEFRSSSRNMKASPEVAVRNVLLRSLAAVLPREKVVKIGAELYLKFSIMISNVLFSLDKLKVFGHEIDDVQFLAFAPLGCYCGVATYAGKLNCNIVVAKDCDSEPADVLKYYKKELEALHDEVMSHDAEYFVNLDKPKSPSLAFYAIFFAFLLFVFVLVFDVESWMFAVKNSTFMD